MAVAKLPTHFKDAKPTTMNLYRDYQGVFVPLIICLWYAHYHLQGTTTPPLISPPPPPPNPCHHNRRRQQHQHHHHHHHPTTTTTRYLCSVISNNAGKLVLPMFPYPLTLSLIQFLLAASSVPLARGYQGLPISPLLALPLKCWQRGLVLGPAGVASNVMHRVALM